MSARSSLGRAAVTATAVLACASAAAAAATSVPLQEQILAPPTTGYFNWNRVPNWLFTTTPSLWPDATLRGFWNEDNASLGEGPGAALTIDPVGGLPLTPTDDRAVPAGSLHGQWRELSNDRLWTQTAVAVDGRNWTLESGLRTVLVERDEELTPLRSHAARALEYNELAITRDGLRVISTDGYRNGKPLRLRILDARLRTVLKLPASESLAVAVTGTGRLLLISADRIQTVGRRGELIERRWPGGPQPSSNGQWQSAETTPTARGTMVMFGRRRTASDVARHPLFLATLDAVGAVTGTRSLDRIDVPWPADCVVPGVDRDLLNLSTGPASTPIVSIRCTPPGGQRTVQVAFELDASLRFRRLLFPAGDDEHQLIGVLPDGRVGVVGRPAGGTTDEVGAHIGAYELPDAIASARGKVVRLTAGRRPNEALARLECRRPPGTICNGVVTVRASVDGAVLGWAPYALPGRPGWAPARFDRRIPLDAGDAAGALGAGRTLPAGAVTELTPLAPTLDRTAVQPPVA